MKTNILSIAILGFLFFCSTNELLAQTFFEDAKGKTSIFLPIGGNVRINISDESLKFSYFHKRSDKDLFFGDV